MKPLKVLYVLPFNPKRILYGSELRSRRIVQFLKTKGEVDLLTLEIISERTDTEYIERTFRRLHALDALGKPVTRWQRLRHLLPRQLSQIYSEEAHQAVRSILAENDYDVIFVSKLFPVKYFLNLSDRWTGRVIMDFDDFLSDLSRSYWKDAFTSFMSGYILSLYERRALSRFRRVFICSEDARTRINRRFHPKVGIIPNVYETHPERILPPAAGRHELLFVGSLDYLPNLEGLQWFLRAIWPKAKERFKDLKLTVIGKAYRELSEVRRDLGEASDVEVELNVDSVLPYYRRCFASIVPILDGSGTRLKILESCSLGRPVLTTRKGVEGLDLADQRELLVFQDGPSFLAAYQQLLTDGRYEVLTRQAFRAVQEKYSPKHFDAQMESNWRQVMGMN